MCFVYSWVLSVLVVAKGHQPTQKYLCTFHLHLRCHMLDRNVELMQHFSSSSWLSFIHSKPLRGMASSSSYQPKPMDVFSPSPLYTYITPLPINGGSVSSSQPRQMASDSIHSLCSTPITLNQLNLGNASLSEIYCYTFYFLCNKLHAMLCLDGDHISEQKEWFKCSNICAQTKLSSELTAFVTTQKWYVIVINVICTFDYMYCCILGKVTHTDFNSSQVQEQQYSSGYAAVSQEEKPG